MSDNVSQPISPIELQTDRLLLRPMYEGDIAITVASLGDLEISRRLARIPHPYTEADARWWLDETRRGRASGTVEHFMIELRASGAPIGAIGLYQDAAGERAEVGYWLAKAHWNRGYAREALAMVVRNGLRGVGDTTWILWITVASCYGLRLPLAWYLGVHLGHGLVGIWWALSAELVVRGLLFLLRFLFGRWDRITV